MNSHLFLLNAKDFLKGAITAVFSAVLTALVSFVNAGGLIENVDWYFVVNTAVAAFAGYILKNYLSDSNGKLGGKI